MDSQQKYGAYERSKRVTHLPDYLEGVVGLHVHSARTLIAAASMIWNWRGQPRKLGWERF